MWRPSAATAAQRGQPTAECASVLSWAASDPLRASRRGSALRGLDPQPTAFDGFSQGSVIVVLFSNSGSGEAFRWTLGLESPCTSMKR